MTEDSFAGRIGAWLQARTALDATRQDIAELLALLRDPTDAMTEAGADHVDRAKRVAVDGVWSAMIDQALADAGLKGVSTARAGREHVPAVADDAQLVDHAERVEMTNLEMYRANAAAQRLAASQTNLPNRRAMHERSALSWEAMAANAADTIERAGVNEAAKARLTTI